MIRIGFVIVSHRDQAQLLRLVTTLNAIYGRPPIACHHDWSQAPLDPGAFPENVRFVRPSRRTGWAKWSVVAATLDALALLYEGDRYARGGPDWFVLMSAADYPIRPARAVLEELAGSPYDAYLDAQPIGKARPAATLHGARNPKLDQFDLPGNRRLKWDHSLGAQIWIPIIRRKPRLRPGRHTIHLPFETPFHPFTDDFGVFYGDHWFSGNRRVAALLLNPTLRHLKLQRHLSMRTSPDECYYQTVLCNTPGLSICLDNKRYAEWNGGGAHPMDLTPAQVPELFASDAHFARKFAPRSPALDMVDARLLSAPAEATSAHLA